MILHPDPSGLVAILQSAHALLAFQIADHWGNRETPRPAPRADVLAAVMLHDAGWDGREEPPRLGPSGRPLAFDTLAEEEREALWTAAVERAAVRGRYVAYLVSHHVSYLASVRSQEPHHSFLGAETARRERLRAELAGDPRYRHLFTGPGDAVNRAVVRITDALAVHLALATAKRVVIPDLPRRDGWGRLELRPAGPASYRLRPWPLAGHRLDLAIEGRALGRERWHDETDLRSDWANAGCRRLKWTLLAPGEAAD